MNLHHLSKSLCLISIVILFTGSIAKPEVQSEKYISYQYINFDTIANFYEVSFTKPTYFGFSKFHKAATFYLARFHSYVSFAGVKFDSFADLSLTRFYTNVSFQDAEFNSNVEFNFAEFDSIALFFNVKFHSTANFYNAEFKSINSFENVLLPDTLFFGRVKSFYEIDFTTAYLDSLEKAQNKDYRCQIDLVDADINKIKINYELFKLWFRERTTYEKRVSTYEKLLKKFKDDGFLESYKLLDIEYQDFKNKHNRNIALNCFLKNWWNYGYNKEWVLYWSFCLFLLFSFINIFTYKYLQKNVYEIKFVFYEKSELQEIYQKMEFTQFLKQKKFMLIIWNTGLISFYFIAFYLINPLIYTALLFFGIKISTDNFKKFSPLGLYVWLIYLVGLFCVAYIFNIIIVK